MKMRSADFAQICNSVGGFDFTPTPDCADTRRKPPKGAVSGVVRCALIDLWTLAAAIPVAVSLFSNSGLTRLPVLGGRAHSLKAPGAKFCFRRLNLRLAPRRCAAARARLTQAPGPGPPHTCATGARGNVPGCTFCARRAHEASPRSLSCRLVRLGDALARCEGHVKPLRRHSGCTLLANLPTS